MFVVDQKLFTLEFIDQGIKDLNLRFFDGDKPSPLSGVNLNTVDTILRQHGKQANKPFL